MDENLYNFLENYQNSNELRSLLIKYELEIIITREITYV